MRHPARRKSAVAQRLFRSLAVLFIGDVLAPGRALPFVIDVEHCEVSHEAVRSGAVPVLFARLEEHAVAGADNLDRPAAPLAAPTPSVT